MIIDQDPERVVPNICEKDFQNHVVIIRLELEANMHLGMLVKKDNIYYWKGSRKYTTEEFSQVIEWGWLYLDERTPPENTTLMQILINSYRYYKELGFAVTFYVIEDITELLSVLRGDI